jgi:transcriptional regulator with XRE-family HTH domain
MTANLTVAELAGKLSLTINSESRREGGYLSIPLEDLPSYAEILGCRVVDLVLDAEKLSEAASPKRGRPTKPRKS